MEKYCIFLKINEVEFTLSLDQVTFNSLTANPTDLLPDYIKVLQENNALQEINEIRTLAFSLDNKTFLEIGIQPPEPQEDRAPEPEMWDEQATKLLLDKYETYLPLVGPLRKFKKKKQLWSAISEDIKNILNIQKTAGQCENRYKTVLKRKKNIIKTNRTSGESPKHNPYEEELSRIAAIDDSVEPPVRMGVGKCIIVDKNNCANKTEESPSSSRSATPTFPSRKRPVSEVLMEIAKEKEEGRNRRHKEKLDLLRNLAEKFFNKTD
ncbi:uncharacterized protein LOC116182585 [Photinus pyralis]|nr:uncharacterized protein LOC116159746 [Photinus pyralis]XP_031356324.1 uncharacterized protein LOC116180465 [Photinus pyralis]XP_031358984.1 uncharacterized protein LOC116182585 [Photinus pyralis]